MKEKRNTILVSSLTSVGIAAIVFCIHGVIFDFVYGGNFHLEGYAYTKMVIGTLVIGLGFGIPTFVYENENMSTAIQTLIHMGIGCVVMTLTSYAVGWIPGEQGAAAVIAAVAGEIGIAFVIWLFFYIHRKKLARQINQRIAEMNQ